MPDHLKKICYIYTYITKQTHMNDTYFFLENMHICVRQAPYNLIYETSYIYSELAFGLVQLISCKTLSMTLSMTKFFLTYMAVFLQI